MDEEATIASLALHIVVSPILDQIEQKNLAAGQTLRSAFHKVEKENPGFTQDFLGGLVDAEKATVNLTEALLRLACSDVEGETSKTIY
jgi:programmed cell death protein 10